MAFEYQGFATLGVNLNRQKYGPLDISNVFTSQADLNYYLTKGTSKDGVSSYWLNTVPYPYEGQVLATVIDGVVNVYVLAAKEDGNFETQEIGGKVEVDGKTIKTDANGKLQLVGLDAVEAGKTYVPSLVNGVLTWAEPDTSTAEGQEQEINGLKTRVTAVEGRADALESKTAKAVGSVELDPTTHNLVLKDVDGNALGTPIDTSIFVQDSFLNDVEYDADTHKITFTWKMGDESTKTDEIDIADLVDTYTAGSGLSLTGGAFAVDTSVIATKGSVDSLKATVDEYKSSNDEKVAGIESKVSAADSKIDSQIGAIKTNLGKSSIEHTSEDVTEGVTVTDATLKIVVDAYTKAEADKTVNDAVKVVSDALDGYKTSNDAVLDAVKGDVNTLKGRVENAQTSISALEAKVDTGSSKVSEYVAAQIAGIPAATASALGLVKASAEVTVAADGTLGLGEVSTDKLVQGSLIFILDGNATEK